MDPTEVINIMKPIVLSKLGVEADPMVRVEISTQFDKTIGLVVLTGPNNYKIIYHPEQKDPIKVICHELVHVAQHLRGDVFQIELPYKEQPHEIEAYALEDELVEVYNDIIKG